MARKSRGRPAGPQSVRSLEEVAVSGHGLSDEEIERSLLTGENSGILEDLFGTAQYQELRRLTQAAERRSVRGGDRVLILPGLMGSRLGARRGLLPPDIIWFDPVDVAQGRLAELALPEGDRRIQAVGVFLFVYLGLKLRLRIAGYDADFAPYDWRRSLKTLGRELADRIRKEGKKVHLVAHSMGGLVARASFAHDPDIGRLVLIGAPNFGSFAPVLAVRGTHGLIRRFARLDVRHSLDQLAAIFGAFPGLLEMIPTPGSAGASDLFDLDHWPTAGLLPSARSLTAARTVQESLPTSRPGTEIIVIAGVDQETVVDARRGDDGGEFVYTLSHEGDGTVPLRCALLPGADQTYYVKGRHGFLAGIGQVQRALPSILATGRTGELPETPPAGRQPVERAVPESELKPPVAEEARGRLPSVREQRFLLAEVAAPEEVNEPAAAVAAPGGGAQAPASPARPFGDVSDMVVVGRGRTRRLEITLAQGSIVDADAQCYVVGLFKTVAPGGAAQALDACMNGAISDLVARRMFGANVGEVSILPTGSHPLRAQAVGFVGLGSFDSFSDDTLEIVGENLIRTFAAARVDDFAMVPFGGGSFPLTAESLRHLMMGLLRGLQDVDGEHRFRGITIVEYNPERFAFIRETLFSLSCTPLFDAVDVIFRDRKLVERYAVPARAGPPATERVYLIVREAAESEADPSERPPLIASLLTSGDKAAIHSGEQPPEQPEGALDAHLRNLAAIGRMGEAQFDAFGERLAALVLHPNVRQALAHFQDKHLVVVHDAGASRIPWEAVKVGDGFPALRGGLSHRYEASNLSVAKWLESRQQNAVLSILLIVNPTGDLDGAELEGARIKKLADDLGAGVRLRTLAGDEARKSELMACFGSGDYDVVHYAGHAFFDPHQRSRSGLLCAGKEVLSGEDLATVGNLPSLMFFNACEAARVRGGKVAKRTDRSEIVRRGIGFAEALLRGGIANFMGTYWPVGDAAAEQFAIAFYGVLLKGASLDTALRMGREAVREGRSRDWADYVFYGNPDFLLKLPPPQA